MQELIGKQFSLAQDQYLITDVRNIGGEFMVYAKASADSAVARISRRAFHYSDIAHLVLPNKTA